MNSKEQIDIILKLYEKRSSKQLFKDAIKELLPSKNNYITPIILLIVSAFVAFRIGFCEDTVSWFQKLLELMNGVILALFGIVFTGYSIFQAIIDDELLMRLLENSDSKTKKSRLQISNEYFINVMALMVIAILLNVLLLAVLMCIPEDVLLLPNQLANETIAALGIGSCMLFEVCIIAETKSFIFNVFQIFNISAGSRAIDIMRKQDK